MPTRIVTKMLSTLKKTSDSGESDFFAFEPASDRMLLAPQKIQYHQWMKSKFWIPKFYNVESTCSLRVASGVLHFSVRPIS